MNNAWLADVLLPAGSVSMQIPLLEGVTRLKAEAARVLLVLDQAGRPAGMFGAREVLAALATRDGRHGLVVGDVMSTPCPIASRGLHPTEAWQRMRATKSGGLLLVDAAGVVEGMLTERELMRHPVFRTRAEVDRVASAMRKDEVSAAMTLGEAVRRMADQHVDCLLVEENGEVVGILGEDEVLAEIEAGDAWRRRPVREAMRTPGPVIAPDASLARALDGMAPRGVCMAVVDAARGCIGVLTLAGIAKVVCRQDSLALAAAKRRRALQASGGRARAWLLAMVAVFVVFFTEQLIEHLAGARALEQERNAVLERLSTLRARLEGGVNANLYLARGLTAVIAAQPDLDQASFAAIARGLVSEDHALRIVAGAPGMVVSLMYPMPGNEAVIGLDYRTHPTQRGAALRARDSGRTVIAGPLPLIQGGVGIIVREPVFLPAEQGGSVRRFWGLVSAVIDAAKLYRQAGLTDPGGLRLALRGTDGRGARGPVFFGDGAIFGLQPVTQDVELPGGSWQLAAVPATGWGQHRPGEGDLIRLMGLVAAIASGALVFGLVRRTQAVVSHAARVEALLNTVPDLVWMKDPGGVFVACNPRFEAFFSVLEADVIGRRAEEFLTGKQAEAGISVSRDVEEWISFDAFGNEAVFEAINTPVADANGNLIGILGVARDITERKRADAALRESETRYRQLFENSPAPMLVYEKGSLRLLSVNAAFVAHYGYSSAEALEMVLTDLYPEPERPRIVQFASTLTGLAHAGEWQHLRKDGSLIVIEARSHDIDYKGHSGRVAVIYDITQRKRLEEQIRALNADLEARVQARTQELAAANKELETFTYSVSHDLKAPLRGIDGYSRLLLEDHGDQLDEEGRLFLENVHRGVIQMNQLIEDLLAYSRMERCELHGEPVVLAEQVARVLAERRSEIEARGMQVDVKLDGLVVPADRGGLAMVLRNLTDNAIKFTKDCQAPRLGFSGRALPDRVVLEISDNGIGFDMRFHDRIFEIFQRLQRAEHYPGTGVGLAIVRKAMLRMGGSIRAQSAPGEGATFFLEFPR